MNDIEARLKEEYGGMIVNTRKVGEAVMIGTDIAIMPVRVIGQQVRLGVVTKSGLFVAREDKFREIMAAKKIRGPERFRKLYRNIAKHGGVAYYSLEPSNNLTSEVIDSADEFREIDEPITVVKYGSKLEAEAFAKGVELSGAECRVSVEVDGREWYVIVQHFNAKTASREGVQDHEFHDFSFL